MTLVRLTGNYKPDLTLYSPGGSGAWEGVRFTTEEVNEADFLISLNYPEVGQDVCCPSEHCWALIQEPPTGLHHHLHSTHRSFSRIYSCDEALTGAHRVLTHPHLHWYLNRSFDWLSSACVPEKQYSLSTVTSSLEWLDGHKQRFGFLQKLKEKLDFDWYGRGVRPLEDKWDGLAPYRYSLALENHRSGYYWTEKLIDCYLAWTMPIYSGCPRIAEYFPSESMVLINLDQPEQAEQLILETVRSQRYEENLDAIRTARNIVLQRYNPLAFLSGQIREHQMSGCCCLPKRQHIPARRPPLTVIGRTGYRLKYGLEKALQIPVRAPWLS